MNEDTLMKGIDRLVNARTRMAQLRAEMKEAQAELTSAMEAVKALVREQDGRDALPTTIGVGDSSMTDTVLSPELLT